jgi:hypothetical protein
MEQHALLKTDNPAARTEKHQRSFKREQYTPIPFHIKSNSIDAIGTCPNPKKPHTIFNKMNPTIIILQAEHQKIQNPEGSKPTDRYFRLRIERQHFQDASRSTSAPITRKGHAPKYFIHLHVTLPKRTSSNHTFAVIPMDQFTAFLPKDYIRNEDLVIEIEGSLGDEPLLVIVLKIKKRTKMRLDEFWALLQIGDEVYPDVCRLEDLYVQEFEEEEPESEPEPIPKPSLSLWSISHPDPDSMQLIFLASNGEPDHVKLADPAPWINPSAGMRRSSDSDDKIYLRILYKHPARRNQTPWPRPEEGDVVAEYAVQLRLTRVIHLPTWVDNPPLDEPIEGVPIELRSNPPPEPKTSQSPRRVRIGSGELIRESGSTPRPLHSPKPVLRAPRPAFPELPPQPPPPPLQRRNTLSKLFRGKTQDEAEPEKTRLKRRNSLKFWGKK